MDDHKTNQQKSQMMAAFLAFLGAIQPTPVPMAGLHKFYLGQPGWGAVYLLLGATPVPRIAAVIEGVWYLVNARLQSRLAAFGTPLKSVPFDNSDSNNSSNVDKTVEAVAKSLREIEHLRQEGLLSEHEFEQKRRSLLDHIP